MDKFCAILGNLLQVPDTYQNSLDYSKENPAVEFLFIDNIKMITIRWRCVGRDGGNIYPNLDLMTSTILASTWKALAKISVGMEGLEPNRVTEGTTKPGF